MVAEIRQFISPEKKVARPSILGQLAFVALANTASGLLWWAVTGTPWVATMTIAAQSGGPALVALLGWLFGRQTWVAPELEFNPRRSAVFAYFTGAMIAMFSLLLKQTW